MIFSLWQFFPDVQWKKNGWTRRYLGIHCFRAKVKHKSERQAENQFPDGENKKAGEPDPRPQIAKTGANIRIWTEDLFITSELLYRLSYIGTLRYLQ